MLFSLTIALLINCNNKKSEQNSVIEKLAGTWIWIESSGGIDGSTTKAANENVALIEFGKDGTYRVFINGKEKEKTGFSLSQGKSIYSGDSAWLIKYGSSGQISPITQSIMFKGQDTLFLNDECNDCMISAYKRKK